MKESCKIPMTPAHGICQRTHRRHWDSRRSKRTAHAKTDKASKNLYSLSKLIHYLHNYTLYMSRISCRRCRCTTHRTVVGIGGKGPVNISLLYSLCRSDPLNNNPHQRGNIRDIQRPTTDLDQQTVCNLRTLSL